MTSAHRLHKFLYVHVFDVIVYTTSRIFSESHSMYTVFCLMYVVYIC